ncbi:MAG: hypothetical protein GX361_03805 [Bacteroidales bacterium]|nr:hypothetical protein [Bacteroidales bacterium]
MNTKKFDVTERTNQLVGIYEDLVKLEARIVDYANIHIPLESSKVTNPVFKLQNAIMEQITRSVKLNLETIEDINQLKL